MSTPTRRRRGERSPKRAGELTPRDIEILTFIGRAKAVTTDAIAILYFGDRSTASRRLARLQGAGLVKVHVEHLNAPNWYALTERGAEHLVAYGIDERALHVGRFPRRETLEHLRYLNEFRAALDLAARDHGAVTVETFLSDFDLRRLAGADVPSYVPDFVVSLAREGRSPLGLLGEVDLGNESARFIASTKGRETLAAYQAKAPLWGLARFRVLFLAPSLARLRSVGLALANEGADALWLGTTFDRLREVGPLGFAFAAMSTVAKTTRTDEVTFNLRLAPEATEGSP